MEPNIELNADELAFIKNSINSNQFETFRLAGDASTRKYYRVIKKDETWALMVWEPFGAEADYPFLNILNHFHQSGILVPDVHAVDNTKGLVLLEDLGDLTLERKFWENQDQSLVVPFYKKTLDQLVSIHTTASEPKNPKPICQQVEFNYDKFLWELNYARTHLLEGLCALKLSDSTSKELIHAFDKLAGQLAEEPKVVCHRDFHSRNVMLKLGKTYIIDFQDARLGPRQYDLVSLLYDSYVNMEDDIRSLLLDYYISKLPSKDQKTCESEHFSFIFSVQMIQRCFKACGSFASFYQTRKDTRYLKYLVPTLRTVASEAAHHKDFKVLSKIIESEGLTERDYENL